MTRMSFSTCCLRRQSTRSLIVKSLNRFENDIPVILQPAQSPASPSSSSSTPAEVLPKSAYKTTHRSAYSVLRSRNSPPDVCAQNLLSVKNISSTSRRNQCCCTALVYRVPEQETVRSSVSFYFEEKDRERDDFVFSLNLASVEKPLRDLLGETKYEALVGSALAQAKWVGLCEDLSLLRETEDEGKSKCCWVARLLLTPEEDNRVKWLHEDGELSSAIFARVPSFRAMYVAYHTGEEKQLEMRQFEAIEARIMENGVGWDMSDAAVACSFALNNKDLRPYFCHVVRDVLLDYKQDSARTEMDETPNAELRHVLGAMLLLHCFKQMQREADEVGGHIPNPPTYLLEAATHLFSLSATLSATDEVAQVVKSIATCCRKSVISLASTYIVPIDDPQLPSFTLWLLKEAPSSFMCHHHFHRMVQRSQADALELLEKSNLLSTKSTDLRVVMTSLVPLLDSSGCEEFFFLVIREVLLGLEERLRRDPHSFSKDDLGFLATLGARLFETNQNESIHPNHGSGVMGSTGREQLEELQVMDGSPWALVAFSYSSLKEILRALLRDHRRLKRHVQAQVRTIVDAVTSDAASNDKPSTDTSSSSLTTTTPTPTTTTNHNDTNKTTAETENTTSGNCSNDSCGNKILPLKLSTPPSIRERFVAFVEELIQSLVDVTGSDQHSCKVVSNELFTFVRKHVPLPNIHDEYRRKIFLLVNVFSEGSLATDSEKNNSLGSDVSEQTDEIPAELRLLVSSLPLTLSPWASVMILREVLSKSAGNNPRYTYVLNAAIDLQLPISTTRSRIATTLNMWRFLSSQADKLTMKEQVTMKQRCVFNLPLSYILSSYWSLLTWLSLLAIIGLNIVGLDFESQYVATRLFREFGPPDDVLPPVTEAWNKKGAEALASIYIEDPETGDGADLQQRQRSRSSSGLLLSSASYIFLGADSQRRPMTVIPVGSNSNSKGQSGVERSAEEIACASAILRELSGYLPFPFYIQIEKELPVELIISRVAERIRRVSFNNAWFVSRVIFRTFPLGRCQTEYSLVSHTCAHANLTRRRMTFLLYINQGVMLPPQLLCNLQESVLAQNGNLVIVAHEDSLKKGGTTKEFVSELTRDDSVRWIPYNKEWAKFTLYGPPLPTKYEKLREGALSLWRDAASRCTREYISLHQILDRHFWAQ